METYLQFVALKTKINNEETLIMQEEKQNLYEPQEMNKNPPRDNTTILLNIERHLSTIDVIVLLMFLLQIGVVVYMLMYGLQVRPVWYY